MYSQEPGNGKDNFITAWAFHTAQGHIAPEIPAGSKQCVYAIYDDKQRLQYIGIGSDLRNGLRTCVGRRPDKAFYYR